MQYYNNNKSYTMGENSPVVVMTEDKYKSQNYNEIPKAKTFYKNMSNDEKREITSAYGRILSNTNPTNREKTIVQFLTSTNFGDNRAYLLNPKMSELEKRSALKYQLETTIDKRIKEAQQERNIVNIRPKDIRTGESLLTEEETKAKDKIWKDFNDEIAFLYEVRDWLNNDGQFKKISISNLSANQNLNEKVYSYFKFGQAKKDARAVGVGFANAMYNPFARAWYDLNKAVGSDLADGGRGEYLSLLGKYDDGTITEKEMQTLQKLANQEMIAESVYLNEPFGEGAIRNDERINTAKTIGTILELGFEIWFAKKLGLLNGPSKIISAFKNVIFGGYIGSKTAYGNGGGKKTVLKEGSRGAFWALTSVALNDIVKLGGTKIFGKFGVSTDVIFGNPTARVINNTLSNLVTQEVSYLTSSVAVGEKPTLNEVLSTGFITLVFTGAEELGMFFNKNPQTGKTTYQTIKEIRNLSNEKVLELKQATVQSTKHKFSRFIEDPSLQSKTALVDDLDNALKGMELVVTNNDINGKNQYLTPKGLKEIVALHKDYINFRNVISDIQIPNGYISNSSLASNSTPIQNSLTSLNMNYANVNYPAMKFLPKFNLTSPNAFKPSAIETEKFVDRYINKEGITQELHDELSSLSITSETELASLPSNKSTPQNEGDVKLDGTVNDYSSISFGGQNESGEFVQRIKANLSKVNNKAIFTVDNKSIDFTGKISDSIKSYFKKIGGYAVNPELGKVELGSSGAKTTTFHGIGNDKFIATAAIKDVIEKGNILEHSKNWKNRGYDTYVIAGRGYVNNEDSVVGVIVKSYPERDLNNKFYLHEVIKIGADSVYLTENPRHHVSDMEVDNSLVFKNTKNESTPTNSIPQNEGDVKLDASVMGINRYAYNITEKISEFLHFNSPKKAITRIINGDATFADLEFFAPGNDKNRQLFENTTGIKLPDGERETFLELKDFYKKENSELTLEEENGNIKSIRKLSSLEYDYVKNKSGWSDDVVRCISSLDEAFLYMDANLREVRINDRIVLIRDDIDLNQVDSDGRTNRERLQKGWAVYTTSGEKVELHHIGQKDNSPLAELTHKQHMQGGNNKILHETGVKSEINRSGFSKVRESHWRERLHTLE